jgi:hypothetical protein
MDLSNVTEQAEGPEYDPNEDRELYIQRMKDEGFKIVLPESNEVFIDIDSEEDYLLYQDQMKILCKMFANVASEEHESRNGLPGRHITLFMPFELSDAERIGWQASLGSDYKRELLSMIRLTRGDLHPTLFVEKNNGK